MGRRQQGFLLIEVLVVVVLIAIALPALLMGFTASYVTVRDTRMLEMAKHAGQIVMERALADPSPVSGSVESPINGYDCSVVYTYDPSAGRTLVTVTVRYAFLAGQREYTTVAIRYGG